MDASQTYFPDPQWLLNELTHKVSMRTEMGLAWHGIYGLPLTKATVSANVQTTNSRGPC